MAASDGDSDDGFGTAVGMDGTGATVLVGAPTDEDPNGTGAGAAYAFTRSGGSWSQQAKLLPDDGDTFDRFGNGVTLSPDGGTALVGAWRDEGPEAATDVDDAIGPGSAYVFERDGANWTQRTRLTAADGDGEDGFGDAVALGSDGRTALVGAKSDADPNGTNAGSAYVFGTDGSEWTQRAKLVPDDGSTADWFGDAVALSGDGRTALVGAPQKSTTDTFAGGVYVFGRDGGEWTQQATLGPTDGGGFFGDSVALSRSGDTALVGASNAGPDNSSIGAAYVFAREDGTWAAETRLVASDGDKSDSFGHAVTLSDDGTRAVIGTRAGAAYLFGRDGSGWTERAKLAAGDEGDGFGATVALADRGVRAVVGASEDGDPNGDGAGSAYIFEF